MNKRRSGSSQEILSRLPLAIGSLAICLCVGLAQEAFARERNSIPDRLFPGKYAPLRLPEPPAPVPSRDTLFPMPGEDPYFPIRVDGQPYVLNIDNTVNLTDALNHFYYDPRWRGEVWSPFESFPILERGTRLMSTWPEYDEANQFRKFNNVNKFFERWTGFGP